ncbi:DUF4232 domain-containing protein [Microbacterium sp. OVT16B]|uniref:DUF4232 domain-containing protein n=1 Tax=Microbacterium sp. OVT16B TaxID=2862682 RepID=UPI001CBF05A9|nr:DUF4232 domain-containing protein [Microbacterium sp. OVT16B]
MRRGLIGGGVLAVLWFFCGWLPYVLSGAGGSLATLGQLLPSPMRWGMFGSPVGWAIVEHVLTLVVLVGGFALLASWFSTSRESTATGRTAFAAAWLAAVLTAFAIGAALDLGSVASAISWSGIRGAAGSTGFTMSTTWWAALVGWLPALVFLKAGRGREADATPAERLRSRSVVLAAVVAVALVALPVAAEAGSNAAQEQLRQDQATAEVEAQELADPDGAAPRDPDAPGEPVPAAAPAEGTAPDGACTAEDTFLTAPGTDAATGHRGQWIQLVNVSEEPCVVEGYPDVAYGDQNGHLLDVIVEHGGAFMAQDPGPAPVTLQPGEAASAVIGWDANSVNGQLAARSVWIAVRPGELRSATDISLDIIPGATVHVTAWQIAAPSGS